MEGKALLAKAIPIVLGALLIAAAAWLLWHRKSYRLEKTRRLATFSGPALGALGLIIFPTWIEVNIVSIIFGVIVAVVGGFSFLAQFDNRLKGWLGIWVRRCIAWVEQWTGIKIPEPPATMPVPAEKD